MAIGEVLGPPGTRRHPFHCEGLEAGGAAR
jgi:hypothetical protein